MMLLKAELWCMKMNVCLDGAVCNSGVKRPGQLSNFSDYPSNFFFQKHLATNLAIFKIDLATFSNF